MYLYSPTSVQHVYTLYKKCPTSDRQVSKQYPTHVQQMSSKCSTSDVVAMAVVVGVVDVAVVVVVRVVVVQRDPQTTSIGNVAQNA